MRTRLLGSRIAQAGTDTDDVGATVWADYEMDRGWRQQWIAMHFGNDLQLNDFGYLSRNSTNYLHWELRKRFTGLPEASRYASKDWRWRVSSSHNNHGDKLNDQFRMSREGQLRDGSYEYAQINVNSAGLNDTLLRGNGVVRMPANFNTYFEYERPRKGDWAHETELEAFTGGLTGMVYLLSRGVEAEQSFDLISSMMEARLSDGAFFSLQQQVERDLMVGTPVSEAATVRANALIRHGPTFRRGGGVQP